MIASTLRTPPTAHAPRSIACRPIRFASRVVRCGTVSNPCASSAPGQHQRVHADPRQRAAVDVDRIDFARRHHPPTCSTMRLIVTPFGGSISTDTTNFSA